uniref:receptor-like kinase LIP1 n=1 Tax=Erigeron canadensis TaxID=72917 RepID=UPI001CB88C31|nr:receptor-like kinase LIP1 [Erigeron canadensis]
MSSTNPAFKHLQFSLEEVLKATNNFDDKYVIGRGGYGNVYKGQLLVSGEIVNIAARRLDPKRRQRGDVEFWNEITMLSSLKHENIVSLIGFCDENGEKIIIIKREATKGSLSVHLSKPTLTWIQRLNICVGVARALRYIHSGEGRGSNVIHRNINSYTVLLDAKFESKLSGFEYSIKQSVTRTQLVLSEAIGTKGYMDPSILKTGGVTHKSDIYSFGVVLCEILCGRKASIPDGEKRFLATLFRIHYEKRSLNDIIHPDLRHQMTQKSLIEISKVAYYCLMENSAKRPRMEDIIIVLEKALELENLIKKLDHLKIPLSDILSATENLSDSYSIGDRDYCSLYAAELEHFDEEGNRSMIDVKDNYEQKPVRRNTVIIKRDTVFKQSNNIENGEEEEEEGPTDFKLFGEWFYREINILHTCTHPSVIKLLGFCVEGSEMIIVVEYLSNGTLNHLWYDEDKPSLTWAQRLKICLNAANALNYLHYEMEDGQSVTHHNLHSGTIALDENLGAKITDFGFSSLLPRNIHNDNDYLSIDACYLDPYMGDKYKRDSDVYTFGIFMFEVLCGREANDPISEEESSDEEENTDEEESFKETSDIGLAFEARRCFQDGTLMEMIDPSLLEKDDTGENNGYILEKSTRSMSVQIYIRIAYWCIAEFRDERPTMKVVVKELQKALFFQVTYS